MANPKTHGDDNTPNVNRSRADQPGHQVGPETPAQPQRRDAPKTDPDLTEAERPLSGGEMTDRAIKQGEADKARGERDQRK